MAPSSWSKKDFESARAWIAGHEEEARTAVIMKTGTGAAAILPGGLMAFGAGIHGYMMFSPLPVLMGILAFIPIFAVVDGWPINLITTSITGGCIILLAALLFVTRLMLRNRELFPRIYFVTLGTEGIAMHFSRFHYPFRNPKAAIAWKDIKSLERKNNSFASASFSGIFPITAIETVSVKGERVSIPLNFSPSKLTPALDEIETIINALRKR